MSNNNFIEFLGNPIMAFILLTFITTTMLHFFVEAGKIFIIIIIAFFVSDILAGHFAGGGRGTFISKITGSTKTQRKGHAYIIFYIMIVITTIVGDYLANQILVQIINPQLSTIGNQAFVGGVFSFLIVLYVETRFYNR